MLYCWQYDGTFRDYLQAVAWHQHLPSPQALGTYCVCVCVCVCVCARARARVYIHKYIHIYISKHACRLGTKFKCCCVIAEFSNQES